MVFKFRQVAGRRGRLGRPLGRISAEETVNQEISKRQCSPIALVPADQLLSRIVSTYLSRSFPSRIERKSTTVGDEATFERSSKPLRRNQISRDRKPFRRHLGRDKAVEEGGGFDGKRDGGMWLVEREEGWVSLREGSRRNSSLGLRRQPIFSGSYGREKLPSKLLLDPIPSNQPLVVSTALVQNNFPRDSIQPTPRRRAPDQACLSCMVAD